VAAVKDLQPLQCEKSQPPIGTDLRVLTVGVVPLRRLEKAFLNDVRRIEPRGQLGRYTQTHHRPQSVSILDKPLLQFWRIVWNCITGVRRHSHPIYTACALRQFTRALQLEMSQKLQLASPPVGWEDAAAVVDRHFVSSRKPDHLPGFCKAIIELMAPEGGSTLWPTSNQ
jgi:hypothetical protein